MNSDDMRKVPLKVSGDNVRAWIEAGIRAMAKGKIKDDEDVVSMKLNNWLIPDQIVHIEIQAEKGVKIIRFG